MYLSYIDLRLVDVYAMLDPMDEVNKSSLSHVNQTYDILERSRGGQYRLNPTIDVLTKVGTRKIPGLVSIKKRNA